MMSVNNRNSESGKLILAANNGDAVGVLAAIMAGADKEAVDSVYHNYTALHWSAVNGHRNVVFKLFNAGVNVNARDNRGRTALHQVCLMGHEIIASLLIGRGVLIDATDTEGRTPLMLTCWELQGDLFELLLDAGADIGLKDKKGGASIHYASRCGHDLTVSKLIQLGADVNCMTNKCNTPIWLASYKGHDKVVKLLIDNKAQVDHKISNGGTALYIASSQGHAAVAHLLIANSADVNATEPAGYTPLMIASQEGRDEIVSLLITYGANIEAVPNNRGYNALAIACAKGQLRCVSKLIEGGADLNKKSRSDKSPLYIASRYGHLDIVITLLRNGAQKNIPCGGFQATHIAAKKGHLNVLVKLQEFECDLNAISEHTQNTPLHLAVLKNHVNIAKWLIINGANPYACKIKGDTAIQLALKHGNNELASFMTSNNIYSTSPSTSAEPIKLECAVCLDHRTSTVMTLPCRHAKTCQNCMDDMEAGGDNRCPICRAEITQRIPIFL